VAAAAPLLALFAFLLGSIPWGYLIARRGAGIDLRAVGSGGTGATNVLRTMGRSASIAVLVLDGLKGAVPILVGRALGVPSWWLAVAAVAAVAGHCWSPWIGFKGGKGVATGAGAAIALWPPVALVLPLLVAVVAATRFVSLGSLVACGAASLLTLGMAGAGRLDPSVAAAVVGVSLIVVVQHRANIARLRSGTERRFGERVEVQPASPS
jgi:acyl phosphate:glycerol-3-phosphate acyltransferase